MANQYHTRNMRLRFFNARSRLLLIIRVLTVQLAESCGRSSCGPSTGVIPPLHLL